VNQEGRSLVQTLGVLTSVQGYLIHKTLFDSITGANHLLLVSCQSLFSIVITLVFSSPVYFKDTWSRSCTLRVTFDICRIHFKFWTSPSSLHTRKQGICHGSHHLKCFIEKFQSDGTWRNPVEMEDDTPFWMWSTSQTYGENKPGLQVSVDSFPH
jgi:hypothetical protein